MTYTSFGNFAPLYTEPKRRLVQELDPSIKNAVIGVLDELAAHSDERGISWPGTRRLCDLCRYAPTTIENALSVLVDYGYLLIRVDHITRSRSFQLSPYVLYIAPDHIEGALFLWNEGSYVKRTLINVEEPESTPESEPVPEPVSVTSIKPTPDQRPAWMMAGPITPHPDEIPYPEGVDTARLDDDDGQREAQTPAQRGAPRYYPKPEYQNTTPAQRAKQEQRVAPQTQKPNVPRAISEPLTALSEEATAKLITSWRGGTTLPQARGIVRAYGATVVQKHMMAIDGQKGVRNPVGLLLFHLKNDVRV